VQKDSDKAWHDRHIRTKKFQVGELVLLYDSTYLYHPGKFFMHWLGSYVIKQITKTGVAHFGNLDGQILDRMVNGNRLKIYRDN
jgi:hypothetical protein